jgi:hypothetical protein
MRIALLKRQIKLWLILRIVQIPLWALLLLISPELHGDSIRKRLAEPQLAVVLLAAAIGLFEVRRHHELILAGNLGITWRQVAAILITPSVCMETLIVLIGRL